MSLMCYRRIKKLSKIKKSSNMQCPFENQMCVKRIHFICHKVTFIKYIRSLKFELFIFIIKKKIGVYITILLYVTVSQIGPLLNSIIHEQVEPLVHKS